jgi:hypothetical protein
MSNDLLTKYKNRAVSNNQLDHSPEFFTRYNGGYSTNRRSPYITGYWITLIKIPNLFSSRNESGNNIPKFLCSTAESFTPPTRTITKSDIVGFGGVKKNVITGQDIGDTFNITFREYDYLPVYNIFSTWTNAINVFTGKITNKYKGQIAIGMLKPTGIFPDSDQSEENKKKAFEDIFFFEGVMPETDPIGSFDGNIETNESKTIDITFSYDGLLTGAFDFNSFYDEFKTDEVLNLVEKRDFPELPVGT